MLLFLLLPLSILARRSKSQIGPIATGRKVGKVEGEEVVLSAAAAAAAAAASKPTMEIDRPIKGTHTLLLLLLPLKPIDSNSRKCTLRALSTSSSSHQNARDTEKERNGKEWKGKDTLGEERKRQSSKLPALNVAFPFLSFFQLAISLFVSKLSQCHLQSHQCLRRLLLLL